MDKRTFFKKIITFSVRGYLRKKFKPMVYYDKYKITPEQHHTQDNVYNICDVDSFYYTGTTAKGIEKNLSTIKTDADGVKLYPHNGKNYYHPVIMAQWGLKLASAYNNTKKEEYIHLAGVQADKIMQQADFFNELPYFPYEFDFKSGEYAGEHDDGVMKAPWYSGMAQGQALSLFILLYDLKGEKKYLEYADNTFKTLTILREERVAAPWLTYIDDRGYFWIEEYPMDNHPSNVLNGFVFAIFGLYDYYRVTQKGRTHLNQALQAVAHYLPKWRNPGGVSFYCLKYKKKHERYHRLHIKQLKMLHKITEEPYFLEMADLFHQDHPGT